MEADTSAIVTINGGDDKLDIWGKPEEIRRLFCPTLTDSEFKFFAGLSVSLGANPFKREIWAVKYKEDKPAQVFLGRDFYRRKAEEQSSYDGHIMDSVYENDAFAVENGMPKHSYTLKDRGQLMGAYCVVWKKSVQHPYYIFCRFDEYVQFKKGTNEPMALWKEKPDTMIKKVAESQGLRGAYQGIFEGTYDFSERWETHGRAQIAGDTVDAPESGYTPPEDEKPPPETRNEAKERLKNEIADLRQQLGGPAHFNNFMKKYFKDQDLNSMAEIELAKVLIQMQKSVNKLKEKAEAGPNATAGEVPEAEPEPDVLEDKNRPQFVAYAVAELNQQTTTKGIQSIVTRYPQFIEDARFQKAIQQVEANIRATSQTAQEQL